MFPSPPPPPFPPQAAIAVSLSYKCEIFILTNSREETALLKSIYPQLKDRNLCSSEDMLFKKHIQKETNGKGEKNYNAITKVRDYCYSQLSNNAILKRKRH